MSVVYTEARLQDFLRLYKIVEDSGLINDPNEPYYPQFQFIASEDGKDLGFITGRIIGEAVYIQSILVVPTTRDNRVGTGLMLAMEVKAKELGVNFITFRLNKKYAELLKDILPRFGYEEIAASGDLVAYMKQIGGYDKTSIPTLKKQVELKEV